MHVSVTLEIDIEFGLGADGEGVVCLGDRACLIFWAEFATKLEQVDEDAEFSTGTNLWEFTPDGWAISIRNMRI